MKINPECTRDILLTIEQFKYKQIMHMKEFHMLLSKYPTDIIDYHCAQLIKDNMIECKYKIDSRGNYILITINDLNPDGHRLLATIKPESFWKKIKVGISKFGIDNMKAFLGLAQNVAFDCLKELFEKMI